VHPDHNAEEGGNNRHERHCLVVEAMIGGVGTSKCLGLRSAV